MSPDLAIRLPRHLEPSRRELLSRVLASALNAVDPRQAVLRTLSLSGNRLLAGERSYDLAAVDKVVVVGAGKAGVPMLQAVGEVLSGRIDRGVVIVKEGGYTHSEGLPARVEVLTGGHPLPSPAGLDSTRRLVECLSRQDGDDLVLLLLSGGGSALLTLPAPGISLEDLQHTTGLLLKSGAAIQELNAVRKHLDRVKGGGLARMANGAQILALVLSDVVGDPLDAIASGPAFPDPTTFRSAWSVVERYGLIDKLPFSVRAHLAAGLSGSISDTPKPGDPLFERVAHLVIAGNRTAVDSAVSDARSAGFSAQALEQPLEGEARLAGASLADRARSLREQHPDRPLCLVAGGETTVTVTGDGKGGRNLELALGAVERLAGLPDVLLVTLATDGEDGTTGAAGAVVTGETLERALALGMHPSGFLRRNDSLTFFEVLGGLVVTGSTGTNVNDLALLFLF